jgi:hypothetical protein
LSPNMWTVPTFQRNYYQSLYCDFFLHSDFETWPCKAYHLPILNDWRKVIP